MISVAPPLGWKVVGLRNFEVSRTSCTLTARIELNQLFVHDGEAME